MAVNAVPALSRSC